MKVENDLTNQTQVIDTSAIRDKLDKVRMLITAAVESSGKHRRCEP